MSTHPQTKEESSSLVHSAHKRPPVLAWPDISGRGKWSVSSYKFGFGAECLRDGDPDTFWHSDGPQPHFITVEFPRKVAVQKISIYLSYPQDDSYTPATLAVRAGTGLSDLQDVRVISLEKPDGWITFDVSAEPNEDNDGLNPVYAYVLQVIILANHMSGKDTHVRGLRILGPIEYSSFFVRTTHLRSMPAEIKLTMMTPSPSILQHINYMKRFDDDLRVQGILFVMNRYTKLQTNVINTNTKADRM